MVNVVVVVVAVAKESQPGWTHQDSVRTQKRCVRTHRKGQTLTVQHVEMLPVPLSLLLFAWHAEESQPGETSQYSIRTQKGHTHWKGLMQRC